MTGERAGVAAVTAAFLSLVFFRAGVFIYPFPSGSNGVFFDEAHRVLAGEVMYRDFFEFVGPGTAHLNALVFLLCGPRIAALGAAAVALGAALALLVHALSSRVLPAGWRLLPPAAFAVLVYAPYTFGDHKWPALGMALAGLAVAGRTRTPRQAFAAGALLGLGILFTQDLALGAAAGMIAWLAGRGGRRLALAGVAGVALPPLLIMGAFAWKGGLATIAYDWLVFPLTHYRDLNRFRLAGTFSLRTLPRDLAQLALAAGGVVGAIVAMRARVATPASEDLRLLSMAGLGALLATAHRGLYPMGLAVQSAVLIPVAVWALWTRLSGARWSARPVESASLALLALGLLHGAVGFPAWRQGAQPMVLEHHRAGAVWTPAPMPELDWIESRTRPGEGTFLLPARGGHYFLTQTRDVTGFPYLIEGQHTPEQAQAALASIEAARPAVGIWDQRPWPRSDPDAPGPLGFLFQGLKRGYDVAKLPSGVFLLTRKPDAVADTGGPGPAVGERFGAFEAPDQNGRPRNFENLRGPRGLLLNFNRSVLW